MKQRIEQLDSLRGLAALTVAIGHFTNVFPAKFEGGSQWWQVVSQSPLMCVMAGHQAVVFFFVLSGFVLSMPFHRGSVAYGPWIVKRFYRIYFPYFVATLLGIVLVAYFGHGPIPALSKWFNDTFRGPLSLGEVVNNLLLIDSFDNNQINPVVWSLVMEMRISLVFPLVMVFCGAGWRGVLASYGVAIAGCVATGLLHWRNDYLVTCEFLPEFVIGCLLARHAQGLTSWYRGLRRRTKVLAIAAAVLPYTYAFWFLPDAHVLHRSLVDDFFTTIAVVVFIVSALGSSSASSALRWKPVVATGRASYSLYLVHCLCLLTAVHLLFGRIPIGWILVVAGVATVAATALLYWSVETPSIALGRRLSIRPTADPVPLRG
jgi:peptidoglycan/LPS O-acetylase OafA/YrhL